MRLFIFWDKTAPLGLALPLGRRLSKVLDISTEVMESPLVSNGYVGSRKQHDARAILDSLAIFRSRSGISDLLLLVTGNDLFFSNTEFVFGLARASDGVAVVSTYRLENSYYNRPDDPDALLERLVKEAAHETGHLFGMGHCGDTHCVMFAPNCLDELDGKRQEFCRECQPGV
jgi:archaemetzincin